MDDEPLDLGDFAGYPIFKPISTPKTIMINGGLMGYSGI
jgi:hypothetical protein